MLQNPKIAQKSPAILKSCRNLILREFLTLDYMREILNMVIMEVIQRFDVKRASIETRNKIILRVNLF